MSKNKNAYYIPTEEEKKTQKQQHIETVKGIQKDWAKVMRRVRANYMGDPKAIYIDNGR